MAQNISMIQDAVKQKLLIAGGTGLVGKAFIRSLNRSLWDVFVLTRGKSAIIDGVSYINWNPDSLYLSQNVDADIIVNLAGAGIADKRWTEQRKKVIIDSRVNSAETLRKMLEDTKYRPLAYISASAVGYYGDRGAEWLTEESTPGEGFMSECCIHWENAALSLSPLVERLVILRIGLVLSKDGGALPKMLMTAPFRIFNYFGSGTQFYPWIHIYDLVGMIHFAMMNKDVRGIFNAVAPQPETNKDIMQKAADIYGTVSLVFSAPVFALKLMLGEMSKVVLNSNRVSPNKIIKAGFQFRYPEIRDALINLIQV